MKKCFELDEGNEVALISYETGDGEELCYGMPLNTSKVRGRKIRGCQLLPNSFY